MFFQYVVGILSQYSFNVKLRQLEYYQNGVQVEPMHHLLSAFGVLTQGFFHFAKNVQPHIADFGMQSLENFGASGSHKTGDTHGYKLSVTRL